MAHAGASFSQDALVSFRGERAADSSRLLMTYIVTGLTFMLLPGTFLGVWNLIKISSREAVDSVSPAWIQAHGRAQLFGWASTVVATTWKR